MYFIAKGSVDIINEDSGQILTTLHEGSFFGEMALINDNLRSATAKAKTFCDVYTLGKDAFEEILEHHQTFARSIRQMAMDRKKESRKKLGHLPKELLQKKKSK